MNNCLFCKIIDKKIPADIVYEDDKFLAFKDINPKAPIHILIVPKKHIASITALTNKDIDLIGELILTAKEVAERQGISEKGYKLVFNVGEGGGQIIQHIHLHLLAGWRSARERDLTSMP